MRLRRLIGRFFLLASILLSGCTKISSSNGIPAGTSLVISGGANLVTYVCAPITVSAVNSSGAPFAASNNMSVTLSHTGSGAAYATLADCRNETNATSTAFISQGQSSATMYYRDDVGETAAFTATNSTLGSVTTNLTSTLFQVLGQPNGTSMVQLQYGESSPAFAAICGGKLFVSENNRVLVWNSLPTSSNTPPDFALGQTDTSDNVYSGINTASPNPPTFQVPEGVACDSTHLFVADSENSRVLIWNHIPSAGNAPADVVVGQSDFTQANSGAGNAGFFYPYGVATDGTHLIVADNQNSRVLIWNSIPTTNGTGADVVLGQSDFAGISSNAGGANPTASTLSYPNGVFVDASGHLFVADSGNNRMLVWNQIPTANGASADLVLGQNGSFTTAGSAATALGMNAPNAGWSDGTHVLIADYGNNRVLGWNSFPNATTSPDFVLGQSSFTASSANGGGAASAATLNSPNAIASDGTHLVVVDYNNNRTLIYNSLPSTNQAQASIELGQPDFTGTGPDNVLTPKQTMKEPMAVMNDGTHLLAVDQSNNRVLVWKTMPTANGAPPDFALGQPDLVTTASASPSASTLNYPSGVWSDGTRVFVADQGYSRVLAWDSFPASGSTPADFVLGQPNFTTGTASAASQSTMSAPNGVWSDGTRLFVADTGNNRVLIYNTIPTNGSAIPDVVLGQTSWTVGEYNQTNNTTPAQNTLWNPTNVLMIGQALIVADTGNARALIWNTVPTTNDATPDIVLGKPDFTTPFSTVPASQTSLNTPTSLATDGTRLFVSDRARVVGWNSLPTQNAQPADLVFGQVDFTHEAFPTQCSPSEFLPTGLWVDGGTRLFIADTTYSRILILPLP